jgi:hypothetical protein
MRDHGSSTWKPPVGLRRFALAFAAVLLGALASCGSPCPFGLLSQRTLTGQVACCGAASVQSLPVPAEAEVDLGNLQPAGQAGRVDLFLTRGDCDRLFDGAYPPPAGVSPRCPVLVGPVAPGTVSNRQKLDAGTYRLHALAYSSNSAPAAFGIDVAFWGENCSGVVF